MGMAETNSRGIAIGLMRQAMVFLEKAEDWDTAARLQHALDVALAAMLLTQPLAGLEIEPDAASLIVAMPLEPRA
jgi:hypothetical protein